MQAKELRVYIDQELHARPYIQLGRNLLVFHFSFQTGEKNTPKEWNYLIQNLKELNFKGIPKKPQKYLAVAQNNLTVRYERHTEFVSLTLIYHDIINQVGAIPDFFSKDALDVLPVEFIENFPGFLLTACWIEMFPDERELRPKDIEVYFQTDNFAGSRVASGLANIFMSFKLDDSALFETGFTRTLIQNSALRTRRTGRLLQRVIEIETYRSFALLALPVVRDQTPKLSNMEQEISAITAEMSALSGLDTASHKLEKELNRLSAVTAQIEKIASETSYRLAATKAYDTLVVKRLEELREEAIVGFQTIAEFIERRIAPAIRTCGAFGERLADLANRSHRANTLLRTQIEMQIQLQNRNLLRSMENRARIQFRLQETVEGLSVAAITYYIVGLLSYVMQGIGNQWIKSNIYSLLAASIPVVAALIFFIIRWMRRGNT